MKQNNSQFQSIYRLSPTQLGILYHSILDKDAPVYCHQLSYEIKGELDVACLEKAFEMLVSRHDILRTTFVYDRTEDPVQVVHRELDPEFTFVDLKKEKAKELKDADRDRGFDLMKGPLTRVMLLKTEKDVFELVWSFHHIIVDGWCFAILLQELKALYGALILKENPSLQAAPQFKAYIDWLGRQDKAAAQDFWKTYLDGFTKPTGIVPTSLQTSGLRQIATKELVLPSDVVDQLKLKLNNEKQPFSTLIYSIWALILKQYTGLNDFVFGTVVSGRNPELERVEHMVGPFLNTIPLRVSTEGVSTVSELLSSTGESFRSLDPHTFLSLAEIQKSAALQPAFDHLVVFENYPDLGSDGINDDKISISDGEMEEEINYDFYLTISKNEKVLNVKATYDEEAYDHDFISGMLSLFAAIAENIAEGKELLGEVANLENERGILELQKVTQQFNPEDDRPLAKSVVSAFQEICHQYPENTAIIDDNGSFTYHELNEFSSQFASFLFNRAQVQPGEHVSLELPRESRYLVAMLGILKLGALYVPIDPNQPQERVDFILADSQCKIRVTEELFRIFEEADEWNCQLEDELIHEEQGAYLMYTSGTTGYPKGVRVLQEGILRLVQSPNYVDLDHTDCVLSLSSFAFDGSTYDVYGALLNGAVVLLSDMKSVSDVGYLEELIERHQVSNFFTTTALFNLISDAQPKLGKQLKTILFGGELVSVKHVEQFQKAYPWVQLKHVYGPTENTTFSTYYNIPSVTGTERTIPIGAPISKTKLYILNAENRLVPVGGVGEICLAGEGLAAGYLNRPELTEERFDRSYQELAPVLYRTGDLGRWLPDGNVEFLGRNDNQVKVHGFRIELDEVEGALLKTPGVLEATCLVRSYDLIGKVIVGYYTTNTGLTSEQIKKHLLGELPPYMVPKYFVPTDHMPLNQNGKIDKKQLPDPDFERMDVVSEIELPKTDIEKRLAKIWGQLLGISHIGRRDDFFELGGHSLNAASLMGRIFKAFRVKLSLQEIFAFSELMNQALLITSKPQHKTLEIPVLEPSDWYPVAPRQKNLWVQSQLPGGNLAYNVPMSFRIRGNVNLKKLEKSIKLLTIRHESLRTVFKVKNNEVGQVIIPSEEQELAFDFHDLSSIDQNKKELALSLLENVVKKNFNLEKGPLFRVQIIKMNHEEYWFSIILHHIIGDGWSCKVLLRDLMEIYSTGSIEIISGERPLSIQYKDFVSWQADEDRTISASFWKQQMDGFNEFLEIPGDRPRPHTRTFKGGVRRVGFSEIQTQRLKEMTTQNGATLYMSLMALSYALLSKISGQKDVIIGSPVSGRTHQELEDLVGFFVNTLPIRIQSDDAATFSTVLQQVRNTVIDCLDHQHYPFESILDLLNMPLQAGRNPLFDVMVVLQNVTDDHEINDWQIPKNWKINPKRLPELSSSKFDLLFNFSEEGRKLYLALEYSTDIFDQQTIDRYLQYFQTLLEAVLDHPDHQIAKLNYLGAREQEEILAGMDFTHATYPAEMSIVDAFEHRAAKSPNQVAIKSGELALTYYDLNQQANQLADYLINELNIKYGDFVGLELERSERMIISILGVLKAGGAYVPVDPEYPEDRKHFIHTDSACKVVIDENCYSQFLKTKTAYSTANINHAKPDGLAYVIYTSGTTGNPKGVMIEHVNVVRLFFHEGANFDFSEADNWTLFHSYCFDFSVWEIFGALLHGGKLVIVPAIIARDTNQFLDLIIRENVTVLNSTPSAFYSLSQRTIFSDKQLNTLRYVIFGGEALSSGKLKDFHYRFPDTKLINMYGITETTVHVTYKEISAEDIANDSRSIGKPLPTLGCLVLDGYGNQVAPGIVGELHVIGSGLARGYVNKPELTAERFPSHPWNTDLKMYKTGDLVSISGTGDLEYHGRVDDQVKVRGYRIELDEIASNLARLPEVNEATVIAMEDKSGDTYLRGCVTTHLPVEEQDLRTYLKKKVPGYMVPSEILLLKKMPTTSNGKIDKAALKLLSYVRSAESDTSDRLMTPSQQILKEIWKEILGKDVFSVKDSFFELGGHSLKAVNMLASVQERLGVKLNLSHVFEFPTILSLSRLIDQRKPINSSIPKAPNQEYYPLSHGQQRLWILSQMEDVGSTYNIPLTYTLKGNLNFNHLEKAIDHLIDRHEVLRTSFVEMDGKPYQKIAPHRLFSLEVENVRNWTETAIESMIETLANVQFDLEKGPLFEATVLEKDDDVNILMLNFHHIISDGWSVSIAFREIMTSYNHLMRGEKLAKEPLLIQYKDYATWMENKISRGELDGQRKYWKEQLSGELPTLNLQLDHTRPKQKTFNGSTVRNVIDERATTLLKDLANASGASMFMTMITLVRSLFYRYTAQSDMILGIPISGREEHDLRSQLGFYVNTLPIRTKVDNEHSFSEILKGVKTTTVKAYEHQQYPFDQIVDDCNWTRDTSRSPLFDVMVGMEEETDSDQNRMTGISVSGFRSDNSQAKFDLLFNFMSRKKDIEFTITYNTDLFSAQRINDMSNHLIRLIADILQDNDKPILAVEIVTDDEREMILEHSEGDKFVLSSEQHVIREFNRQVAQNPEKIALETAGQHVSFRELAEQSSQIAGFLRENYNYDEQPVFAVTGERSAALISMILGIVKSGAAYLPVERNQPLERVKWILEDAQVSAILSETSLDEQYTDHQHTWEEILAQPKHEVIDGEQSWESTAYVIYTSGSTGKPKGVAVSHRALANLCGWHQRAFNVDSSSKSTMYAQIGFDASVWELWPYLVSGSTILPIAEGAKLDIPSLYDFLKMKEITHCFLPTQVCEELVDFHPEGVEGLTLLTGGDRLKRSDFGHWKVINNYGPTENAVVATSADLTASNSQTLPPIGRPIHNVEAYVFNDHMKLQPGKTVGELFLGGQSLANGYFRNATLTQERFVDHPLKHEQRLYGTGDLVSYDHEGVLYFHGRKDMQMQVRGYRVEPSEIESALMEIVGVKSAIVVMNESLTKGQLAAYYTAERTIEKEEFHNILRRTLQSHMIPDFYQRLDVLPINANGKVDPKQLPKIVLNKRANKIQQPETREEAFLVDVWKEILQIEEIDLQDNFFEIGGTSLKVIQLFKAIDREYPGKMQVSELYHHFTIRDIAALLVGNETSSDLESAIEEYVL